MSLDKKGGFPSVFNQNSLNALLARYINSSPYKYKEKPHKAPTAVKKVSEALDTSPTN